MVDVELGVSSYFRASVRSILLPKLSLSGIADGIEPIMRIHFAQ